MTTPADGHTISPTHDVAKQAPPTTPAAVALLTRLATDHPTLAAQPARERLLAAAGWPATAPRAPMPRS